MKRRCGALFVLFGARDTPRHGYHEFLCSFRKFRASNCWARAGWHPASALLAWSRMLRGLSPLVLELRETVALPCDDHAPKRGGHHLEPLPQRLPRKGGVAERLGLAALLGQRCDPHDEQVLETRAGWLVLAQASGTLA